MLFAVDCLFVVVVAVVAVAAAAAVGVVVVVVAVAVAVAAAAAAVVVGCCWFSRPRYGPVELEIRRRRTKGSVVGEEWCQNAAPLR